MPGTLTASMVFFLDICHLKSSRGSAWMVCMEGRFCRFNRAAGTGDCQARFFWAVRSQTVCRNQKPEPRAASRMQQAHKLSSGHSKALLVLAPLKTTTVITGTGKSSLTVRAGAGYAQVCQSLPSMHKGTGLIPSTAKQSTKAGQTSTRLRTVSWNHLESSGLVRMGLEDVNFQ